MFLSSFIYNSQKLEITKMPFDRLQMVVPPDHRVLLRDK